MQPDSDDRRAEPAESAQDMDQPRQVDPDGGTEMFDNDPSRGPSGQSGLGRRPAPEARVGTTIGSYQITGVLGRGGMGVVFEAYDPMIQRQVAVKLLSEEWSADERVVQRFLAEARSAGKLGHPNTVAIYGLGQEGRSYYLAMEYLSGGAVEKALREKGAFSVPDASRIAADACRGLAAAHAVGLVHRDIKPANLLVGDDGTIKVADFGLVKTSAAGTPTITSPGQVMGTPHFMSPEQCESKPVDVRSDLYSLGATYYCLLTGMNPYADTDSAMQVMFAHCQAEIPDPRDVDPAIPEACSAIIARAMAKSPEDRYQTAEEMLADLESVAKGEVAPRPAEPTPASRSRFTRPVVRQESWVHRNRWVFALGGLAVAALIGATAVMLRSPAEPGQDTPSQPPAPKPTAAAPVQGVTDAKIVFGTSTAYSGPNRDLGKNMVLGVRASFNAVNEAGGIHGRQLELVVLDDGYEPDRAIANMKELFEQREVFAVIGNVGTPTAKVTVPYALEHRYLFFAPFTGAGLLRNDPPDRYVFNYRASYADETAAMVRYFVDVEQIPAERIAVFAQNDAYGDDGFRGVARALRKYGVQEEEIVRVGYERNSIQVEQAVDEIAARRDAIDAIVMVPTYAAAARFIRHVKDRGLEVRFAGVSFAGGDMLAQEFLAVGPEYGEGVIVTQVVPHFQSGATGVIRYREQLGTYFPEAQPGFVSLEGFIAAECLVEGLRKAGPNLTTEGLIDALESIRDLDLGIGPIISFGPSKHQASDKVWGTVLDDAATFQMLELE